MKKCFIYFDFIRCLYLSLITYDYTLIVFTVAAFPLSCIATFAALASNGRYGGPERNVRILIPSILKFTSVYSSLVTLPPKWVPTITCQVPPYTSSNFHFSAVAKSLCECSYGKESSTLTAIYTISLVFALSVSCQPIIIRCTFSLALEACCNRCWA